MKKLNPQTKEVLKLVGAGVFLAGSLLLPGLPYVAKAVLNEKRDLEEKEWEKYNTSRLRFILKRLHKQKMVEVNESTYGYTVSITEKGRRRLLKYTIDDIDLSTKQWDGRWRIIVYDVYESHRYGREMFRSILRRLHFFQLQKSVYLVPYECQNEIEFIRQICGIGTDVIILTISGLENEEVYKGYFGLK